MGGVCGWVVCVDWLCVWMGGWVGRCVHGKGVNTVRGMAPSYKALLHTASLSLPNTRAVVQGVWYMLSRKQKP